jgi:hypothetical protein
MKNTRILYTEAVHIVCDLHDEIRNEILKKRRKNFVIEEG